MAFIMKLKLSLILIFTGHRNNIAHKPYFVRQSYSGSMFSKMNHELPSY